MNILCRNNLFSSTSQNPGGLRRKMNQFLDSRTGTGYGQFFQKASQLHNKGYFTCGEIFSDEDRGNQRQRHQYISLDVKSGDQSNDRF